MQFYKNIRYVCRSSIASDTIHLLRKFIRQFVPGEVHPVETNIADGKLVRIIWKVYVCMKSHRACVLGGGDCINVCVYACDKHSMRELLDVHRWQIRTLENPPLSPLPPQRSGCYVYLCACVNHILTCIWVHTLATELLSDHLEVNHKPINIHCIAWQCAHTNTYHIHIHNTSDCIICGFQ